METKWGNIEFKVTEAMSADNDFWIIMERYVALVEGGTGITDKQLESVIQKHLSEVKKQ